MSCLHSARMEFACGGFCRVCECRLCSVGERVLVLGSRPLNMFGIGDAAALLG